MTAVAVLGTGRMGGAMAVRLASGGFDVTVWNRSRDKAEAVAAQAGARVGATAAEAVSSAEVVISMLADRAAVEATFAGSEGATAGLAAGSVVCEMSTVEPSVSVALAQAAQARGADVLDAPVSGSVPAVEQGVLTIMVGGAEAALDVARPVLERLAAHVFHLGPVGTGAAMKLAVNAVVHGLNQALSEGLILAEAAGIDRRRAFDVFTNSAVAAPFVSYKRQAFEEPDGTPVAFSLDLVAKDLDVILGLAERLGVPAAQAVTNRAVVREALEALGPRDLSALAEYLRGRVRRSS